MMLAEQSTKYLYTSVSCKRKRIRYRLLPPVCRSEIPENITDKLNSSCSASNTSVDSNNTEMEFLQFTISLSSPEWSDMHPENKFYKDSRMYSVLRSERWYDILASHFWDHTKLPCALKFKRAKIYDKGFYLKIFATCKTCKSQLNAETNRKLSGFNQVQYSAECDCA